MRIPLLIRRLLLGAGLALAIVAPATLGGAGAGAQPESPTFAGPLPRLPEISAIAVRPGGTEATITFATVEPTTATIQYNPVVGGSATNGRRSVSSPSSTTHTVKLTGLTSNTGYDVSVVAETSAGRRLNAHAVFQTLKKRVRLVLDEITITDDGDWFGKGEPTWFWTVQWDGGGSGGCFPNTTPSGIEHLSGVCQAGSYGEGTFVPRNDRNEKLALTFAEENFPSLPTRLFLGASASEEDLIDPLIVLVNQIVPEFIAVHALIPWTVPQDLEWTSIPMTLNPHCDGCSVESRMLFRLDVFHDNLPYPPNHGRTQVRSNF